MIDIEPSSQLGPVIKPLNFKTKLAYGLGEIAGASTNNIRAFFLLFFLTNVAGLNASLAGAVLLIGRVWDAINDPLVGWLSDRTHSPWGRRHSWMIYAAVPFGLFSLLQWIVPPLPGPASSQQFWLFGYYAVMGLLQDTVFTAVTVPHAALIPELTQDYNERTSLMSFKSIFALGGSIGALALAQIVFSSLTVSASHKYLILNAIVSFIAIASIYLCVWGTRQRVREIPIPSSHPPTQNALSWQEQVRIILSNQPFICLIIIYLCSWVAAQVTATVLPYFTINWMGLPEQNFTLLAIAVQGTALCMTPVWSYISQRAGKKAVYFMGIPLWLVAQIGLFLLQPGQIGSLYALAVLAGVGISTVYLIPLSMLPDVIDLDELYTGKRREGLFYGFIGQLLKFGIAISIFLVGYFLDVSGFIPTQSGQPVPLQPESALLAIRVMMAPVPAVTLIGGLVCAYFYPISRQKHQEILLELWKQKQ